MEIVERGYPGSKQLVLEKAAHDSKKPELVRNTFMKTHLLKILRKLEKKTSQ